MASASAAGQIDPPSCIPACKRCSPVLRATPRPRKARSAMRSAGELLRDTCDKSCVTSDSV
jgi:hypothetical protein